MSRVVIVRVEERRKALAFRDVACRKWVVGGGLGEDVEVRLEKDWKSNFLHW